MSAAGVLRMALRLPVARRWYQPPVLIYHAIDRPDRDSLPRERFRSHLRLLRQWGVRVVPLEELVRAAGEPLPPAQPIAALTFDDGYKEVFSLAYPILKEYNFPATLFVWTRKVGCPGFITREDMEVMRGEGLVTFGSHTRHHVHLPRFDDAAASDEIAGSKRELEEWLGGEVPFFSYPWGHFCRRDVALARAAGYRAAFATNARLNASLRARDPFALRRMTVSARDSDVKFFLKVTGYATWTARRVKGDVHGRTAG